MNQSPAMILIIIVFTSTELYKGSSCTVRLSPCSASLWPDSNPLTLVRSSERIGRSPRLQTGSSVPGRGRHPRGRHRTRRQGPGRAAKCPLGLPLGPQPSLQALCVGRSRCGVVVVGRGWGVGLKPGQVHRSRWSRKQEENTEEPHRGREGESGRGWGVCSPRSLGACLPCLDRDGTRQAPTQQGWPDVNRDILIVVSSNKWD